MTSWNYVGIDIAKKSLAVSGQGLKDTFGTDAKGLESLLEALRKVPQALVVCEASGAYERPLLRLLWAAGVAVALVSPTRVWHWAKSQGQQAKTDALDAILLQSFGAKNEVQPMPPPSAASLKLLDLLDRRCQLVEERTREKNRRDKLRDSLYRQSLERMETVLKEEIALLNQQIEAHVAASPELREKSQAMQKIKGVGDQTAWAVLAYLPEITTLKRNALVALAGLAPFAKESGQWKGKRRIYGGRAKLRRVLYMAAVSAASHNPVIKAYVERLQARGKAFKCALVAAMRKLLLHLQSVLKNVENPQKILAG